MTRRRGPKTPRFDGSDPLLDAAVAGEVDLHNFTATDAEPVVRQFLENWHRRSPGAVVRIITGKGLRSAGAPILRPKVRALLKGPLSQYVADWTLAPDEGSFVVRVR